MAKVENIKFPVLSITGTNYMEWATDMELHLDADHLSETIKEGNTSSSSDKSKTIIFIRKHIDANVKHDFPNIKDPAKLWQSLKERFDNQKELTLPTALDEWANLRYQDYKTVEEYNSAIMGIVGQLEHCGKIISEEEMLEKTYLTFHKSNYILQEQYRNRNYTKFSELYVALLKAQTNTKLLIKNHDARPSGSKALPEVNVAVAKYPQRENHTYRGRGRRFNRGRGKPYDPKGKRPYMVRNEEFPRRKDTQRFSAPKREAVCNKCGMKGHWFKICRTPEHFCRLYKESLKGKEKEVNLLENLETHLDGSHFVNDFDNNVPMEE